MTTNFSFFSKIITCLLVIVFIFNVYLVIKTTKLDTFNVKSTTSNHVTIQYEKNTSTILDLVKSYVEVADEKNDKMFGTEKKISLTIGLFTDFTKFSNNNLSSDVNLGYSTYYQDSKKFKINLFIRDLYTDVLNSSSKDFYNGLLHEYTHYRIADFTYRVNVNYKKIPAWFNEGISVYNSELKLSMPNKIIDFNQLSTNEQWNENYTPPYNSYSQSYYAIDYLVRIKGINVVSDIIMDLNHLDFNDSFKLSTGKTIAEFQKELLTSYGSNYQRIQP